MGEIQKQQDIVQDQIKNFRAEQAIFEEEKERYDADRIKLTRQREEMVALHAKERDALQSKKDVIQEEIAALKAAKASTTLDGGNGRDPEEFLKVIDELKQARADNAKLRKELGRASLKDGPIEISVENLSEKHPKIRAAWRKVREAQDKFEIERNAFEEDVRSIQEQEAALRRYEASLRELQQEIESGKPRSKKKGDKNRVVLPANSKTLWSSGT